MGHRDQHDRHRDRLRREVREQLRACDGNERDWTDARRSAKPVNSDALLMRSLKDAANRDSSPDKAGFIGWLKEKRWGQFFNPAHFNAALSALTPAGYLTEDAVRPVGGAAERLAESLLKCTDRPKPFENAGILASLARLGVKHQQCVEKCLEWAREDLPSADIQEIKSYLYAIQRLMLSKPRHREFVKDVGGRLCLLSRDQDCCLSHVVSCVNYLSRYRVHHAEILSSVATALMAQQGDVNLQDLGSFARCTTLVNWESRQFSNYLADKTMRTILATRNKFLEAEDAAGLANMIKALEVHNFSIALPLLKIFSARCEHCFDAYPAREQALIASQLVPVLLVRGVPVSKQMEEVACSNESFDFVPRVPAESIESLVAPVLADMGVPFEHGIMRHSFEFDFLIKLPGREPINLEIDGVRCHSIEVIHGELAPDDTVPRQQIFRDKVLKTLGYEVIRLTATQWLTATPDERVKLIRRTLRLD